MAVSGVAHFNAELGQTDPDAVGSFVVPAGAGIRSQVEQQLDKAMNPLPRILQAGSFERGWWKSPSSPLPA